MTGRVPENGRGGFADDYHALRNSFGAVTLGRDVLRVAGPDALAYLQGQCSQDVEQLSVGESADALLLTPQGKLEALVRVTRMGDDALLVDVDEGFGEIVRERLERFKLRVKATIEPMGWRCAALRGPDAPPVADVPRSAEGVSVALGFEWNGVRGVDLLGEAPEVPPEVRHCSAAAWESVRVEAGIPVMGAELDERTIAAEAGLLERCVSFTKGCYTGQELVARLEARGNRVARQLRGLVVRDRADDHWTVPVGTEVHVEGKTVGSVTSTAWSPALDAPVALAYLHRGVEPGDTVELRAPGRAARAEARTLPLVGEDRARGAGGALQLG